MIVLAGPMAADRMEAPNYQIRSVPTFREPKNYLEELAMKTADSSIDALVKDEDIGAKAMVDKLKDKYDEYKLLKKYEGIDDFSYYNRGMMPEKDDSIINLAAEDLKEPELTPPSYKPEEVEQDRGKSKGEVAADIGIKLLGLFLNKGGLAPKYAEHGTMTDKEKRKMLEDNKYFSFMQGYPLFMFPFETAVDAGTSLLLGGGGNPFPKTKRAPDPFADKPVEVIEAPDPNTLRMMMKKEDIMPDDVINPRDVPMVEGEFYYGPMANNYNKGIKKVRSTTAEDFPLHQLGPMAKSGSMPQEIGEVDLGRGSMSYIVPSERNQGTLKSSSSGREEDIKKLIREGQVEGAGYANEGMMPDVPKSRPSYLNFLYSSNIDLPEPRPVPTTFMQELEKQRKLFDYPIYSTPSMGLTAFMNMYKKNKKLKQAKKALPNYNEGTMGNKRKGVLAGDGKYDYDKDRSKLLPFSLSQDILFPAYDYFIKKYIYPDYERTVPTVLDFDKAKSGLERMKYGEPIPEFIEMPDGKMMKNEKYNQSVLDTILD